MDWLWVKFDLLGGGIDIKEGYFYWVDLVVDL